jgi:hypothetical protein
MCYSFQINSLGVISYCLGCFVSCQSERSWRRIWMNDKGILMQYNTPLIVFLEKNVSCGWESEVVNDWPAEWLIEGRRSSVSIARVRQCHFEKVGSATVTRNSECVEWSAPSNCDLKGKGYEEPIMTNQETLSRTFSLYGLLWHDELQYLILKRGHIA